MCQGCGFDPQSGHVQESTNECINKWNSISVVHSLSPFLFLRSINKKMMRQLMAPEPQVSSPRQTACLPKAFWESGLKGHRKQQRSPLVGTL